MEYIYDFARWFWLSSFLSFNHQLGRLICLSFLLLTSKQSTITNLERIHLIVIALLPKWIAANKVFLNFNIYTVIIM